MSLEDQENQPDDFKKRIEEMLGTPEKVKLTKKKTRHKATDVRNKPISKNIDSDVAFATTKTLEELEQVRQLFLTFQEEIKDLAIYEYILGNIDLFGSILNSMLGLIADDIDVDKLSNQGKEDYLVAQKIRASILAKVYNKYKEEK